MKIKNTVRIDRKFTILAHNPVNRKFYNEFNSFLMCAKDAAVPAALEAYIEKCKELGANVEHVESATMLLERILTYQETIEKRVPDTIGREITNCLKKDPK